MRKQRYFELGWSFCCLLLSGGLVVKNLPAIQETGFDPWIGKIPGEGNNPLQYSCLENSMDRGAWWATVHGVAKSQTRLSINTHTFS